MSNDDDQDFDDEIDDHFDEDWPDDSEEVGTVFCTACGAEIYEDAPMCPVCGEYHPESTSAPRFWNSGIWRWLGVLGVIATIMALTCR